MVIHYKPPALLFNAHLETIYPALWRNVKLQPYTRERINTPDHDYLDLDWLHQKSDKLVIISHGLEGNTSRAYVRGMAKAFYQNGFNVLAWNYRGCSEEMNKNLRFYHSGATDDLDVVVNHALQKGYAAIYMVGFSLGGNLTLKYAGEMAEKIAPQIRKAIVFSAPMDLHSSCLKISSSSNWMYSGRFLKSLKDKVLRKSKLMKGLDTAGIESIKTLMEFDEHFTAPLHGFKNALDYYHRCSSLNFIKSIAIPTLVINAKNDPFLSLECYPESDLYENTLVRTEYPAWGGHVGFALFDRNGLYWSELKALEFIQSPT